MSTSERENCNECDCDSEHMYNCAANIMNNMLNVNANEIYFHKNEE